MHPSFSVPVDSSKQPSEQEQSIDYPEIIRSYINHVYYREGTDFICYDADIADVGLPERESAELRRLRDEAERVR